MVTATDKETFANHVSVGEKLEVTTLDGDTTKLTVDKITDTGFGGGEYFFVYGDIYQVKVVEEDTSKNRTMWIWIVVGLALIAASIEGIEPQEGKGY